MNTSSQFETLSRVAACLGLELRLDRDINKGFFLRDLRDPEEVVECSDDEPASLEDAANTLIELLQQADPDELSQNGFKTMCSADDSGEWQKLYGLSVIVSAVDHFLNDPLGDHIDRLVYGRAIELLIGIVKSTLLE